MHFTPEARCPPGVLPGRRRARGELGRGGHGTGGAAPGATRTPPGCKPKENPEVFVRCRPREAAPRWAPAAVAFMQVPDLHGNGTGLLFAPFSWFFCPAFNEFTHRPAPPPTPSDAAGSRTVPRVPQPNPDGSQQGEQPCFGAVWGKLGQKSCAGWVWQPGSSGAARQRCGGAPGGVLGQARCAMLLPSSKYSSPRSLPPASSSCLLLFLPPLTWAGFGHPLGLGM